MKQDRVFLSSLKKLEEADAKQSEISPKNSREKTRLGHESDENGKKRNKRKKEIETVNETTEFIRGSKSWFGQFNRWR